jgi:hypothetical protein
MELYFFTRDNLFQRELQYYGHFFGLNESTGTHVLLEKTPHYTQDPVVSFRIKGLLPRSMIIFTLRQPEEALISEYIKSRAWEDEYVDDFLKFRLNKYISRKKCEDAALEKALSRRSPLSHCLTLPPYDKSNKSYSEMLDAETQVRCSSCSEGGDAGPYDFQRNLVRYVSIFGTSRVLCISHESITKHLNTITAEIFQKAGLQVLPMHFKPKKWSNVKRMRRAGLIRNEREVSKVIESLHDVLHFNTSELEHLCDGIS